MTTSERLYAAKQHEQQSRRALARSAHTWAARLRTGREATVEQTALLAAVDAHEERLRGLAALRQEVRAS